MCLCAWSLAVLLLVAHAELHRTNFLIDVASCIEKMAGPSMGGKIFQQVKDGFDSETNLHKLTIQKYEVVNILKLVLVSDAVLLI